MKKLFSSSFSLNSEGCQNVGTCKPESEQVSGLFGIKHHKTTKYSTAA